jgi:hypothetical protein
MTPSLPQEAFYRPLAAEPVDQGDPFALRVPDDVASAFRYYVYVTGPEATSGTAFPVYGADDLLQWERLGDALVVEDDRWRWAPWVGHVAGLERPFVMLYSRARGHGDPEGHQEHKIRRADSLTPEGPFVDSGEVLTADLDFAIDPDVYRKPDGSLRMAFATDFVEDEPIGTGLAEFPVDEELRRGLGPLRVVARASSTWQIYDARRVMPWKVIPGCNWARGDTVCWHCIEAPVGGLISPAGRQTFLYSGGNYQKFYAIGALVEDEEGRLQDVSGDRGRCVLRPPPERGIFGPGHCSVVLGPDESPYVVFHARFGSPGAQRQMAIAPLRWSDAGLPYCPPLP